MSKPYPWKLRPEDLPSGTPLIKPPPTRASRLSSLPWRQALCLLACLPVFGIWLVVQAYALDLRQPAQVPAIVAFPENRISFVPSPVRYALRESQPTATAPLQEMGMPALPKLEPGMIPVNFTPDPVAGDPTPLQKLSLTPPPPLPPSGPSFSLIGIAQGADGTVATLKIAQDGQDGEIKDVRAGESLLSGYQVSKIAPEYVLLLKGGKTIRVD